MVLQVTAQLELVCLPFPHHAVWFWRWEGRAWGVGVIGEA